TLVEALNAISETYSINIMASSALIGDQVVDEINGDFDVESALKRLLEDTGLTFRRAKSGAYVIVTATENKDSDASPVAPLDVSDVEIIQIYGRSKNLFVDVPNVTRAGIPIKDLSRSIQVFDSEFIEKFQPTDISEIITMSSNVVIDANGFGREVLFKSRGFSAPVLQNGVKVALGIASFEPFNMERIEVLKGPDSINFGEAEPGGLINLVKKKPLYEAHAQVAIDANSNPGYTLKTDFGGAINDEASLRYRVVGVFGDNERFRDYSSSEEKIFIAPTLAYDINENHTVTVWAEYLEEDEPWDIGVAISSSGDIAVPIDTILGHPDNSVYIDQISYGLDFDSQFSVWNTSLRYSRIENDFGWGQAYFPFEYVEEDGLAFGFLPVTANSFLRLPQDYNNFLEIDLITFTANGEFELRGVKNRVSLGLDYKKRTRSQRIVSAFPPAILDLNNLVYEASLPDVEGVFTEYSDEKQKGVFIQNHIDVNQNTILSLGLRYTDFEPSVLPGNAIEDTSETTPQIGLLYKVNENFNVYANYAESFTPNTAFDTNGNILDPETGEGAEFGAKYIFNDSFTVNLAYFQIDKVNVAQTDPNDPIASIASGKQTSNGFEVDAIGNINEDWDIAASYGYVDTQDSDNNDFAGTPKHTVNVFTTYRLTHFGLPEFSIGGGLRYIGDQFANAANSFRLDSTIVLNANVSYTNGPWTGILSVKNLTDEEYVENVNGFLNASSEAGEPRVVYLSVIYDF
ncbi:MAG: TonB-dependent receptor, partial [Pseudomonadota bacterium]